jgi:HK97 family phage portal protein
MAWLPRLRKAYQVPSGPWYPVVRESFPGAWQRNVELNVATASTFHADFACRTLIARDIGKLPCRLVERTADGIWIESSNPAYSPVLRKPNWYQTRNQFWERWMLSKLSRGNAYVLKQHDQRRVVVALHVLDPDRVQVLVSDDGEPYYKLGGDQLVGVPYNFDVVAPSTDIIHDRFNCLHHALVGIPPVYASALATLQGLNIQSHSARLYQNAAHPGGILTAPGKITEDTVRRLKSKWEEEYSGKNFGKVAILGDGLKYEKMSLTAEEGQMIEQLKWTAEVVCSVYHVPPYKIGVGAMPSYNNVQALNVEYYTQSLQSLIEDAEACLDAGLGLTDRADLGVEFDIENLLRMDTSTQMQTLEQGRNYLTPNEGRKRLNLPGVTGGDSVYRQQQDFSLEALAKRDAAADPFAPKTAPAAAQPADDEPDDDAESDDEEMAAGVLLERELRKALDLVG